MMCDPFTLLVQIRLEQFCKKMKSITHFTHFILLYREIRVIYVSSKQESQDEIVRGLYLFGFVSWYLRHQLEKNCDPTKIV